MKRVCRKCGARVHVYKTRRVLQRVTRYTRCPLCGAHPGEAPPAAWMPRIEANVSVEQLAEDRADTARHWAEQREAAEAERG